MEVYEVGEHNGLPFLVLEFCPGGSLDRKLGGTPQPPREAAPQAAPAPALPVPPPPFLPLPPPIPEIR